MSPCVKFPSVKIAIDIRRMTEFGVGTYIRNVVRTLGRLDHETTYFLIGSPAKVKEIGILPVSYTHLDVYKRQGEHYGQLVVYYRLAGLVPPESRPKK